MSALFTLFRFALACAVTYCFFRLTSDFDLRTLFTPYWPTFAAGYELLGLLLCFMGLVWLIAPKRMVVKKLDPAVLDYIYDRLSAVHSLRDKVNETNIRIKTDSETLAKINKKLKRLERYSNPVPPQMTPKD